MYNNFYDFLRASLLHLKSSSEISSFAIGGLQKSVFDFYRCLLEGWSIGIVILSVITLIAIILFWRAKVPGKKIEEYQILLALWIILFSGYCLLSLYLYTPRFILPLFPIIAIAFASSIVYVYYHIRQWPKISGLFIVSIIIIFVIMAFSSSTIVYGLHTIKPAPVEAAFYIKDHYSYNNTIILATGSFRHFQYYLPNYSVKNLVGKSNDQIIDFINGTDILVSERELSFVNSSYVYWRDPQIYPKHELVKFFIYNRSEQKYLLLNGWHSNENWSGTTGRWMSNNAMLYFYGLDHRSVSVYFQAHSFHIPRTLEIYSGNQRITNVTVPRNFITFNVTIPLENGHNDIRFYVPEGCERPIDIPGTKNKDSRCLSVGIQNITIN